MGLAELETIPETGAVFTIGRSRFADNIASHFFIRKDPVVSITCGDEHSAVICQTGRLFVFGSNDWGQLGLGHKNHISKPSCVKALKPEKVTHVACGRAHTLICTGAQKIYACGSDQEGQLGRGTSAIGDSVNTPVLVYDAGLAGSKIVQIAAGSHHSLALTNDGGVFAWGSNLEGQLGLPDVPGLVNKPTKVHIPEPVKQISTGYYHSTFLTESGLVYVCGESESGKLGIDVNFSTQVAPKQMQLPSPAVHVACGGHHTVILADNGNLYCSGSNSSGQLGLGTNVTELHTPKLLPRGAIQDEKVTRISCGESHTAIVTDTGKLFTCGDGRHGKLGLEENENNVHEFTLVQRYNELFVSNVACGGCHTILVGQRRETGMDNSQVEHMQKRKNSLPPLKLPLSRLQSETRNETVNQIIKDQLNPEMKNMEPANDSQSIMEKASEKLEEIANNKDNVINNVTDPMNSTEKSEENTKENKEDCTKVSPEKESLDTVSNEMKDETAPKEMPGSAETSQESQVQSENKDDNDKSEMEVDKENNVQKEKESDSKNNKNDHENNNETNEKAIENNAEMDEQITNETNTAKSEDAVDSKEISNDDKSELMKEQMETNKEDNVKEEKSSEKQTSPTISTPPPKPPRLKPGSGNSSNERSPSMEEKNADVDAENEAKTDKGSERKEENGSKKKEESVSTKSGSSKSMRSKIENEEIIEIDKQDDKEQIIEEKEMNNDNVQDDADVVQSPPPRTSKMSKIFKNSREKKSEAIENDTKTNGTTSHKQKSKMCTLL
ncbi:X-linked retinitis pigmentosa GTPase regulator [Ceratina calcarata]|uniref:X-linked retinitis pigmentosa GTPase regulator n=1 Tax=Ceratina calcarata TaxID=156304 RepID=A0AAJ7N4J9_9HYME|nr:X-linked retinitis pigmentosa GTPase regulator [Ceratina calcarata]